LTGSKLVIMLCLADHANDNGECWPSIAQLAERARIAPANVTRHIKELEAAGYLTVTRTSGTHNTYVMSATPGENAAPLPGRTVAGEPPAAPAQGHPARQRALNHQVTIKNHQGNRQRAPLLKFSLLRLRTAATPAARLQALDAKLGPELRRPLADVVLQIIGTADDE